MISLIHRTKQQAATSSFFWCQDRVRRARCRGCLPMQSRGESVGSVWVRTVPCQRTQSFPWVVAAAVVAVPYRGKSFQPLGGELCFNCPATGDRWRCSARFNVLTHIGFAVQENDRQLLRGNARAVWVMGEGKCDCGLRTHQTMGFLFQSLAAGAASSSPYATLDFPSFPARRRCSCVRRACQEVDPGLHSC